jgi:hypothetical protein
MIGGEESLSCIVKELVNIAFFALSAFLLRLVSWVVGILIGISAKVT